MPVDDPPRRRTPPGSGGGQHGPVLPRPSQPDLYEIFERFLREYGSERQDGISNRVILDEVRNSRAELSAEVKALGTEIHDLDVRVAELEGGERVRLHTGTTGQFLLPVIPPPPPVPAPVPAKHHSSFFTKFGVTLGEQVSKFFLPVVLAGIATFFATHGCAHP